MTRKEFLEDIQVNDDKLRRDGADIGAAMSERGLRFFDAARETLAFGPGAGLVLAVSMGSQSLCAALVDANGVLHNKRDAERWADQLKAEPSELLDRIRQIAGEVLSEALEEGTLFAKGALPLLGVSVAWPAPVTRNKATVGYALKHPDWHAGEPLNKRVGRHLGIAQARSHAINDAAAAAVGVAYLQTTESQHIDQQTPRLAMVLRLAGGIGASTIVVEKPELDSEFGKTSGFIGSILTGGVDHLAGEIGHVPVELALIKKLNENLPSGLGPLQALPCSCKPEGEAAKHLEAYVGAMALAHRIDAKAPATEVATKVLANRGNKLHKRALADIGTLVAASLAGPVAMFNPASIVLTGALAVPEVENALETGLSEAHVLGTLPEVSLLPAEENDYVRVKGAGMVVLRKQVLRKLPKLLGGPKSGLKGKVKNLTEPLTQLPW